MAAPTFPPSPSCPPTNPYGNADQNPAGGYPPSFPQSPTFPVDVPPGSANQNSSGNYNAPQPQVPYPQGSYGNGEQKSVTEPQVPYSTGTVEGNDIKNTGYFPGQQMPPAPGFVGVSDQKPAGCSPMPQPPYAPGPDANTAIKQDGLYPSPGFQLSPDTSGSGGIIAQNASAPPLSSLEKVPGYEHVTFDSAILAPPVPSEWPEKPPDREDMAYLHKLSKEEVKDDVLDYASEHCCYGESFAKQMEVLDVVMSSVYHYTLETFGEKRESAWAFEPYTGQYIDGPMNGPAPGPWEIEAKPKKYYENSKIKKEVPHTAFVKPCHGCASNGYVMCDDCVGKGTNQCHLCRGTGTRSEGPCTACQSTGRRRCSKCNGNGRVKCTICDGHGQVKGFVELTITWTNHVDDYISETDVMPKDKIRRVSGQVVFEEKMSRVWPITHCADQHVNEASNELVTRHGNSFKEELILEQCHSLQIVPIGLCTYKWKNKTGDFCVYGFEQKVYFPDYPQKYCCGCVIL